MVQIVVMAAICGFAVLMVFAMMIDDFVGGPARGFTNAVMQATISDLGISLRGPDMWLQRHF